MAEMIRLVPEVTRLISNISLSRAHVDLERFLILKICFGKIIFMPFWIIMLYLYHYKIMINILIT